ncbi:MAG TPA: PIN domain-containing protein [Aeromicrobium sp.]|nr:PIN domain-containing protein [Aeromicrobium sp.]
MSSSTRTSSSRHSCSPTRRRLELWLSCCEHRLVLSRWVIDELHEVVERKWPDRGPALEGFFLALDYDLAEPGDPSVPISDPKDQPILDAAIAAAVDVIVSGDKHFLSLDLDRPQILTARGFLETYAGQDPTN